MSNNAAHPGPESQLLFYCARTHIPPVIEQKIVAHCKQPLDWYFFTNLVLRHRVVPLVNHNLHTVCPDLIDPITLDKLDQRATASKIRNEANLRILLEIIDLLNANGISALPFKGVTFAISLYGDLKKRQCGDLDLLVHREDFLKTRDLLVREGYHHIYFGQAEASTLQSELVHDDENSHVDLHYGLTPKFHDANAEQTINASTFPQTKRNRLATPYTYWYFSLDPDPVWDRAEMLDIDGTVVPVLCPEDAILVLCSQGIKENWRFLRRISDLAELVRARPDLNWDQVYDQVCRLRCRRKFLLGLVMAQDYLGMPVPGSLLSELRPLRGLYFLSKKYREANFSKLPVTDQGPNWKLYVDNRRSHYNCANLLTMDTLADAVRYFFYLVRRSGDRDPHDHPFVRLVSLFRFLSTYLAAVIALKCRFLDL
jgi:hypothetical protein